MTAFTGELDAGKADELESRDPGSVWLQCEVGGRGCVPRGTCRGHDMRTDCTQFMIARTRRQPQCPQGSGSRRRAHIYKGIPLSREKQ